MRRPFAGCLTLVTAVVVAFALMYVFAALLAAALGTIIP